MHRRAHLARSLSALSLSAAVAACAGEPPPPAASIRDSAGVVIVESEAGTLASLPEYRLGDPEVVLGSAQGDYAHQFSHIIDGFLLSDGSIVIADEETREIRVFSRSGEHLRTFGRRGDGPGEFRFLQRVARGRGDTIVASGWPFGFLSRFTPGGDYLGNTRLGPFWPGLTSFILDDGSLLLDYYEGGHGNNVELWIAEGEGSYFQAAGQVMRAFPDGRRDTLRPATGRQMFKSGVWRRDLWVGDQPFGPGTVVATDGERAFVGDRSRAEIEVWSLDGRLERLLRWEPEPVGISRADRERIGAAEHYRLRQPERAAHVDRWLADIVYPESKAPLETLAADGRGLVWARVPTESSQPRDRWIGFTDDGPVAQLRPPAGSRLLELGEAYALLVRADELDVERAELRPLGR